MFSKNIRTIYLYLVCLITLFLMVGGVISAIYSTAQLIFPTSYYSNYYDELLYDEKYQKLNGDAALQYEKEFKDNYDKQNSEALVREKNRNIKEIIYSLAFVVVSLPIYAYNWKKIEEDKILDKKVESAGE